MSVSSYRIWVKSYDHFKSDRKSLTFKIPRFWNFEFFWPLDGAKSKNFNFSILNLSTLYNLQKNFRPSCNILEVGFSTVIPTVTALPWSSYFFKAKNSQNRIKWLGILLQQANHSTYSLFLWLPRKIHKNYIERNPCMFS